MKAKNTTSPKDARSKKPPKKDIADSYNQYKFYEGQQYTGMKIGRSHKWYYDKGEWKDHKITPDLWEIQYEVTKRRAGKAPKGSGVPVGTEYHWYILAHQHVRKLDANSYSTTLTGLKYKLGHKRYDKDKWNISDAAQRKRLIKLLKEIITGLEKDPVHPETALMGKEKAIDLKRIPQSSGKSNPATKRAGRKAKT